MFFVCRFYSHITIAKQTTKIQTSLEHDKDMHPKIAVMTDIVENVGRLNNNLLNHFWLKEIQKCFKNGVNRKP